MHNIVICHGFKNLIRDQLFLNEVSIIFDSLSKQNLGQYLKLGRKCFFSRPFCIIVTIHPVSQYYIVCSIGTIIK